MKPAPIWNATLWFLLAVAAYVSGAKLFPQSPFLPVSFLIMGFVTARWRLNMPSGIRGLRWTRSLLALSVVAAGFYLGYSTLWPSVWRYRRGPIVRLLRSGASDKPFNADSRPIVSLAAMQLLAERAENDEVSAPELAAYYRKAAHKEYWEILNRISYSNSSTYVVTSGGMRLPGPMAEFSVAPRPEYAKEHTELIDSVTRELLDNPTISDRLLDELVLTAWRGESDDNSPLAVARELNTSSSDRWFKWITFLFLFTALPFVYGVPIRRYPSPSSEVGPSNDDNNAGF